MIFHLFYYQRGGSLLNILANHLIFVEKKEFHDVFPIINLTKNIPIK